MLPRDEDAPNTVLSDPFALGSPIYEIFLGKKPYEGMEDEEVQRLFSEKILGLGIHSGRMLSGSVGGASTSEHGIFWGVFRLLHASSTSSQGCNYNGRIRLGLIRYPKLRSYRSGVPRLPQFSLVRVGRRISERGAYI